MNKKKEAKRYRELKAINAIMEDPTPEAFRAVRKVARGKDAAAKDMRKILAPQKPKGKGFLTGRYGLKGKSR